MMLSLSIFFSTRIAKFPMAANFVLYSGVARNLQVYDTLKRFLLITKAIYSYI